MNYHLVYKMQNARLQNKHNKYFFWTELLTKNGNHCHVPYITDHWTYSENTTELKECFFDPLRRDFRFDVIIKALRVGLMVGGCVIKYPKGEGGVSQSQHICRQCFQRVSSLQCHQGDNSKTCVQRNTLGTQN